MKKYLILSFMSISICISNVYALSNTPYLNFSGIGTCYKDCEEGGYIEFNWKNKPTMFRFMRTLSENKDNIINNRFYKQYNFKNKTKKVKKKYKFLFLYKNDIANNFDRIKYNNYKSNYVNYKGIYILDNNDICVGYCLIEKAYFGHQKDAVELSQIKSLNKSTNFLKNKIVNPKLELYEKDHGNYIERYAISDNFFEMQAFYPKELENNLEIRIKKLLNYNYIHGVDYDKKNDSKLKYLEPFELNPDSEDDENELDEN